MQRTTPLTSVLWLEDLPEFRDTSLPDSSEVTVIGAGITGVSLALQLVRQGVKVALIEAQYPAWGASGRNAGHMLSGTAEYYARAVELMGREKARAIWAFSVENRERLSRELLASPFDTGYQKAGYLACATEDVERRELEQSVQLLREDGFQEEYWTTEQLSKRYGRHSFLGARFSPDDAMVHPACTVWALLEAYLNEGGTLHNAHHVEGVSEHGEGLLVECSIPTGVARLKTTMVAWCLNAWTPTMLYGFKDAISPVRGQMLATERLHKVLPGPMAANFGYEYWRQAPRGEVVLGGWRWSQKEGEYGQYSEEPNPEIYTGLEAFMRERFPKLEKASVQRMWTGVMGFSVDGLPFVGQVPGKSGQVLAAGFTGHGFGMAWNSTRLLAEEMLGGRLCKDLEHLRPSLQRMSQHSSEQG